MKNLRLGVIELGLVVRIGEIAGASSLMRQTRAAPRWAACVGPRRATPSGPCRWLLAHAGGKPGWAGPSLAGPCGKSFFNSSVNYQRLFNFIYS